MISALLCIGLAGAAEPPAPAVAEDAEHRAPRVPVALVDPFAEPLRKMEATVQSGYPRGGTLLAVLALEEHPDHPRAPLFRLELSRVQRDLGLLREEELTLARGLDAHPTRWQPWFELAILDAQLQRQDFGSLTEAHADRADWPAEISGAAHFYGAWGRAGTGDEEGAKVLLAKVRGDLQPAAAEFSSALDTVPVRTRSPTLASVLSVVPGAGHIYADDPVGAVANLVVTGALGGAAAYFSTQDEPLLVTAFGILGGASLVAGMSDAGRQASSFNRANRIERFETLADGWWLRSRLSDQDDAPLAVRVESLEE